MQLVAKERKQNTEHSQVGNDDSCSAQTRTIGWVNSLKTWNLETYSAAQETEFHLHQTGINAVQSKRSVSLVSDLMSTWREAQKGIIICNKKNENDSKGGIYSMARKVGKLHTKYRDSLRPISNSVEISLQGLPFALETPVSLEEKFNQLAQKWYQETGMMALLHKKVMHQSYQTIIGMGKQALPLILQELNQRGGHWLWALCAISGEDAAHGKKGFKEAVEAWLEWGRDHGYI